MYCLGFQATVAWGIPKRWQLGGLRNGSADGLFRWAVDGAVPMGSLLLSLLGPQGHLNTRRLAVAGLNGKRLLARVERIQALPQAVARALGPSAFSLSSSKLAPCDVGVAEVERSEPPENRATGGSLRSTPATLGSNLEPLKLALSH